MRLTMGPSAGMVDATRHWEQVQRRLTTTVPAKLRNQRLLLESDQLWKWVPSYPSGRSQGQHFTLTDARQDGPSLLGQSLPWS